MFLGHARTGRISPKFGRFMCVLAFYPFGIMAWNLFSFPFLLCYLLLAVWREVKKRLPLVRLGVEEGLTGIRLLQASSSPLCL